MLSVAIIARDEERHIGACLASISGLAHETVVLLDQRSRDRTAAIATAYGARVVVEPWRGFAAQRNRAMELCTTPWVLFLDADERLSTALYHEIAQWLQSPQHRSASPVGYWIPRYNIFFGQTLRGGGWYPDHQLRLLRRGYAHYPQTQLVHEQAVLNGPSGYLYEHIWHHNIDTLGEFWQKQTRYALAEARIAYHQGQRARWRTFLGGPVREFWRRYVRLGGWRDGWLGLFLCASLAWFEVVRTGFLRLIQL